jgi:predicted aminopeptidase
MQAPEQGTDRSGGLQARRARLGELAVDERQQLPALLIQPRADQPRRGGEAGCFKMAQQRVYRRRPRAAFADHHVAAAVDDRPAAFQADQLIR